MWAGFAELCPGLPGCPLTLLSAAFSPGSSMGTRSQTSPGECLEACSPYSSCKDPNASDLGWDPWRGCSIPPASLSASLGCGRQGPWGMAGLARL